MVRDVLYLHLGDGPGLWGYPLSTYALWWEVLRCWVQVGQGVMGEEILS